MKYIVHLFLLGTLTLAFVFSGSPGHAQIETFDQETIERKSVLILISSQYGMPWYMTAVDEIISNLEGIYGENKVELHVEFSGLEVFNSPDYSQILYDLYQSKYEGEKFDLIISMADIATKFLIQYRDTLFPGTPVVFIA